MGKAMCNIHGHNWRTECKEYFSQQPFDDPALIPLRDQFAMAAMQGDWASQCVDFGQFATCSNEDLERHAKDYYRLADAMLKARESTNA